MLPSRYELSDLQWEKIKDFLLGRAQHVGRTAADNRLFVNGVLWALRSGARWADLPERYGKYKSVHKRFVRSRHPSETARYNASTTKNSTNNAIASSDASANSNVFAASPLATRNQKPASTPWSHSPALGCISGYMSIRPGLVEPVEGSATDKVLNSTGAALASTLKPSHRSCFERLTP